MVAIVAVVALVLVILIVAIAALVSGGDDTATSTTTTTDATTTTAEGGSTTESTTESTTSTTTGGSGPDTSDDYPAAERQAFLDSCTVGGAEDYCLCFLEGLEEIYTYAELEESFADLGTDPTQWPPELQALAAECQ